MLVAKIHDSFFVAILASEGNNYQKLSKNLEVSYWSFLGQCGGAIPKTNKLRWIFGTWVMSSLILTTAFTANLQMFLNFDSYEKQIATTEDIIESKLDIGYDSLFAFAESDATQDKHTISKGVMCDSSNDCLDQAAYDRNMAVIKIRRNALFMRRLNYSAENGFLLYICKKGLQNVLMQFALVRGHPMADCLNENTIRIMQAGFVHYYTKRFEFLMSISYARMPNAIISNALSLNELVIPFLILGLGMIVSLFSLFVELYSYKVKDRAKNSIFKRGHYSTSTF